MTNMITRCPACETSFRITEAQLNTAKGAVRCGSCLQIFRALDNLVGRPAAQPKRAGPQPKQAAPQARQPAAKAPAPAKAKFVYTRPAPLSPIAATSPAATERKPAPQPVAKAATALNKPSAKADTLATSMAAKADDDWQFAVGEEEVAQQLAQEGMLKFNQKEIDAAEADADIADDLLISDEMPLPGEHGKSSSSALFNDDLHENFLDLDTNWKPSEKSLFDRDPKAARKHLDDDEDEDKEEPDESWAISLLEEDDEDEAPRQPATAQRESQSFGESNGPAYDPAPAEDPFEDFDIVDDDEPEEEDESEAELDSREHYSRSATGSFSPIDFESDTDGKTANTDRDWDEAQVETKAEPEDGFDYLHDDEDDRDRLLSFIQPEPVEFAVYQGRNWRKTMLWSGLALVAAVLLVGQVAWLQFDRLSRQEPYRNWYAALCPLVGCTLPSLAAPDMIRTSNLVVRTHPRAEGALMVDTILLNTAAFQQPFPDLVLTFSSIHGETLASRRFTPSEYLAGELAGRSNMPSNQPVHLSLEIVDPGPDAVNYSAYIPE